MSRKVQLIQTNCILSSIFNNGLNFLSIDLSFFQYGKHVKFIYCLNYLIDQLILEYHKYSRCLN